MTQKVLAPPKDLTDSELCEVAITLAASLEQGTLSAVNRKLAAEVVKQLADRFIKSGSK